MHVSSACDSVPILDETGKKKTMKVVNKLPLSKKVNINTFQNQRSLLLSVIAHNMGAPKISKNIVSTQSNACKLGRIVKQQVLFDKTIIMSFYHYHY